MKSKGFHSKSELTRLWGEITKDSLVGTTLETSSGRTKAVLAVGFYAAAAFCNYIAKSYAAMRMPDRTKFTPLPDIILDNFQTVEWGMQVTDVTIAVLITLNVLNGLFHVHKWIIAHRIFSLLGLLMVARVVLYSSTILPIASYVDICSPVSPETTFGEVVLLALRNMSSFGLMVSSDFCGDYIFSGHTMTIILLYMNFKRYTPDSWFLLHWMLWALSFAGIILLLLARGHYTVDILLAYYFATRLFWTWHTLAEVPNLKIPDERNLLTRACWFRLFKYMESGVDGVVPNVYSYPWRDVSSSFPPIPTKFQHDGDFLA